MNKFWEIVRYEYTRHVFRKRFIFALLSLPLVILAMILVIFFMSYFTSDRTPIGYVDHSGVLANPIQLPESTDIFDPLLQMIPFKSEEKAKKALQADEIQTYFILPEDYEVDYSVPLIYYEQPGESARNQISRFIHQNLFAGEQIEFEARITEGTNFTLQSLDGEQEFQEDEWYNILVPFIIGMIFIIVVMASGGYLLQAVIEEKENRTMEIVITSVSPMQLMAGKIIGNISVGLTQLVVWSAFGWLAFTIGGQYIPFIANLQISTQYITRCLLLMFPAFVTVAALMAAIGATMTQSREAQQISGLFTIPVMMPYWFAMPLMMNPNGSIAIFLSYFPLSAPVALSLRMAFTPIPFWEYTLNLIFLVAFAIITVWLAGRAFRIGMLQYGKRISLSQLFRKEAHNE